MKNTAVYKKDPEQGEGEAATNNPGTDTPGTNAGALEQPAPDLKDDGIPNRNIGKREWDEESERKQPAPGDGY